MQQPNLLFTREELRDLFRIYRLCLFRDHSHLAHTLNSVLKCVVKHSYGTALYHLKQVLSLLDLWSHNEVKPLKHFANHYMKFFVDISQKIVDHKRSEGYVFENVKDRTK